MLLGGFWEVLHWLTLGGWRILDVFVGYQNGKIFLASSVEPQERHKTSKKK